MNLFLQKEHYFYLFQFEIESANHFPIYFFKPKEFLYLVSHFKTGSFEQITAKKIISTSKIINNEVEVDFLFHSFNCNVAHLKRSRKDR